MASLFWHLSLRLRAADSSHCQFYRQATGTRLGPGRRPSRGLFDVFASSHTSPVLSLSSLCFSLFASALLPALNPRCLLTAAAWRSPIGVSNETSRSQHHKKYSHPAGSPSLASSSFAESWLRNGLLPQPPWLVTAETPVWAVQWQSLEWLPQPVGRNPLWTQRLQRHGSGIVEDCAGFAAARDDPQSEGDILQDGGFGSDGKREIQKHRLQ